MAQPGAHPTAREAMVRVTEEVLPPFHPVHGTPHAVVRRRFTFELPQGVAEVEQTDYGHPGRLNPCTPRRIAPALQSRTESILAAAEALARLLGVR
jgi:hypothetical protein